MAFRLFPNLFVPGNFCAGLSRAISALAYADHITGVVAAAFGAAIYTHPQPVGLIKRKKNLNMVMLLVKLRGKNYRLT